MIAQPRVSSTREEALKAQQKCEGLRLTGILRKQDSSEVLHAQLQAIQALPAEAHPDLLLALALDLALAQEVSLCAEVAGAILAPLHRLLAFLVRFSVSHGKALEEAHQELQKLFAAVRQRAESALALSPGVQWDQIATAGHACVVWRFINHLNKVKDEPRAVHEACQEAEYFAASEEDQVMRQVLYHLVFLELVRRGEMGRARGYVLQIPRPLWQVQALLHLYSREHEAEDLVFARLTAQGVQSDVEERLRALGAILVVTREQEDRAAIKEIAARLQQGDPLRRLAQGYGLL